MANEPKVSGPTADRVAANIRQLRRDRALDLSDLSARLTRLGHPMGLNTLSKIERGRRRVDVDDLVALALALDVTPNRLLLTGVADDVGIFLAGESECATSAAWTWASGSGMLPQDVTAAAETPGVDLDRLARFVHENRPHDPPDTTMADLQGHVDQLMSVMGAVDDAGKAGVSWPAIRDWLDLQYTIQAGRRVVDERVAPNMGANDGER